MAGRHKAKRGTKKSAKKGGGNQPLPKVIAPDVDAPRFHTDHGSFDLDDPVLPEWIEREALPSANYPYDKPLKDKHYEKELTELQIELVKLQKHVNQTGLRLVIVFEGRDAAGKGGSIFAFRQYLNPRSARIVALPKPSETERGQWYFQRYAAQLPTAGEIVLFDRSWYNRAGVEIVMGFCTPAEHKAFLRQAPSFEQMLIDSGIVMFKFWLEIGRAMQLKQFHERRHNPLKIWKLSPIDYAAMEKWEDYSAARDAMLAATDTEAAPWLLVKANDKKRARLNVIRHVLESVDYAGKDKDAVRQPDPLIVGAGPDFLKGN